MITLSLGFVLFFCRFFYQNRLRKMHFLWSKSRAGSPGSSELLPRALGGILGGWLHLLFSSIFLPNLVTRDAIFSEQEQGGQPRKLRAPS